MSLLERAIREAARDGRLDKLSIVLDRDGRGWQANAPSPHGNAWTVHIDQDPVLALLGALTGSPPPKPSAGVFD